MLIADLKSQPGCPDPQATNFDPMATSNDGSCQYPPTLLAPLKIANLPREYPVFERPDIGGWQALDAQRF